MAARRSEDLVAAVRAALADLAEGAGVVVAVSGGPDSAALADLARRARPDLVLTAVHVRHGLRDDAPDAAAARELAELLGMPHNEVGAGPVSHTKGRPGPEAAARAARYAALRAAAAQVGAVVVLVGHTADDRAETVLLRIVRGTGTKGLGGMAPDATIDGLRIVRPLLGLRRSAVRGHARAVGLPTALDPTNADPAQPRARARALLPQLDGLAGGPRDAVTTILRLADLAAADAAALDDLALKVLRATRRWGPAVALPIAAPALPPAVAARVVRGLIAAAGGDPPTAAAVSGVLALAPGGVLTLPGDLRCGRSGGWLVVAPAAARLLPVCLEAEASAPLDALHLRIATGGCVDPAAAVVPPGVRGAGVGRLGAGGPYVVRGPERGDRLPDGRGLADALARAGVPRLLRPFVPVVCDGGGAPLWAPGVAGTSAGLAVALQGGRSLPPR